MSDNPCLQQLALQAHNNRASRMKLHVIPREATVAELERKAADAEQKSANELEPRATELREEARVYREWAASLRSGCWTS